MCTDLLQPRFQMWQKVQVQRLRESARNGRLWGGRCCCCKWNWPDPVSPRIQFWRDHRKRKVCLFPWASHIIIIDWHACVWQFGLPGASKAPWMLYFWSHVTTISHQSRRLWASLEAYLMTSRSTSKSFSNDQFPWYTPLHLLCTYLCWMMHIIVFSLCVLQLLSLIAKNKSKPRYCIRYYPA